MKIKALACWHPLALVCCVALVGCGGGGGGGAAAGQSSGFDVQAALAAMFQTPATYALTASVSTAPSATVTVVLTATDSFAPNAPVDPRVGDFPGTVVTRTAGPVPNPNPVGATVPTSSTLTYYYSPLPFRLLALEGSGRLARFTGTADLPARARIGESGGYGTVVPDDGGVATQVGWSVEPAETPDTAFVCLNLLEHQSVFAQCVRVGVTGALLGERTVQTGGLLGLTVDLRSPMPSR